MLKIFKCFPGYISLQYILCILLVLRVVAIFLDGHILSMKVPNYMVGCVLRPIDSEVKSICSPLRNFYTVPNVKRTPGRRVAVHYTTAASPPHL